MTDFEKNFYPFNGNLEDQNTVQVPVWLLKKIEEWAITTAKIMDKRYDPVVHPVKGRIPAWMACKFDAVGLANAVKWQYDKEWRKTCSTSTNATVATGSTTPVQPQKQLGPEGVPPAAKRRAEAVTA